MRARKRGAGELLLVLLALALGAGPLPGASLATGSVRSRLLTNLGCQIETGPVLDAAADRAWRDPENNRTGYVAFTLDEGRGPRVRVYAAGLVVIESDREVDPDRPNPLQVTNELNNALGPVLSAIASRTAELESDRGARLDATLYNCQYYLSQPGVYKRLVFRPGQYKGKIQVPTTVKQAWITARPVGGGTIPSVWLGNQELKGPELRAGKSIDLRYGTKSIEWTAEGTTSAMVLIEAITSPTPDPITYYDNEYGEDKYCVAPVGSLDQFEVDLSRLLGGVVKETVPLPPVRAELRTSLGTSIKLASENGSVLGLAKADECEALTDADVSPVGFRFTTEGGRWAYVCLDGSITVDSPADADDLEGIHGLFKTLETVVGWVTTVNVRKKGQELDRPNLWKCYAEECDFSLPAGVKDRYKRLVFPAGRYEGHLNVPQCAIQEARIIVFPGVRPSTGGPWIGVVKLAGEPLWLEGAVPVVEVKDTLKPGTLPFFVNAGRGDRGGMVVVVEAITSPTEERITYEGTSKEQVIYPEILTVEEPAADEE